MPTKKRALRAAFVVTTAIGAAACDSNVSVNPPDLDCPSALPFEGDACNAEGTCHYDDGCDNPIIATCDAEGTFHIEASGPPCNPPIPVCPDVAIDGIPADGSECDTSFGVPQGCAYDVDTACGPATITASCVMAGDIFIWDVVTPECTPPRPACSSYSDPVLCGADTWCRWLVQGCESEPGGVPFTDGCYPIDDCTIDTCPLDTECSPVTYNPCWNSKCAACGAEAFICTPFGA
jgi:hypothetical protein